jgi:hypothetical protein
MLPAPPLVSPRVRLAAALALGVLVAAAGRPAAAQTDDDLARLRQVFTEGRQLEGKSQWGEALKKFEVVAAGKMTPQIRFHIALCEENLGKLVSAMKGFELAAEEAKELGSAGVEVLTPARQHADALRGRIGRIQIDVSGKLTTSKVVLDDAPLATRELGVALPADPGPHVVEVRDAAGKSSFHKDLTLAEKGSEKVLVTVDDADAPPPPDAPVPPPGRSRVPAYVVGGVGVGALALSGVFFGLRAQSIATLNQDCKNGTCPSSDNGLLGQSRSYTVAADALLGVGIASVVTAGVLFFVLGPRRQPAAAAKVTSVRVEPTGNGVRVLGVF